MTPTYTDKQTASAEQEQARPNRILVGDVRQKLSELPDHGVDCVVTSPPYFQLRDYGTTGQLGLEENIDQWVTNLRSVCRDIARVLTPKGVFWLNIADTYALRSGEGAAKKSLLLGPQRLAVALQADGWIVRNEVIWHKTNPLPSNVADRLSSTKETILLLTRSPHYNFDLDAIRVPAKTVAQLGAKALNNTAGGTGYPPAEVIPKRASQTRNGGLGAMKRTGQFSHPLGKNPGDVWQLATSSYRGRHFATFPIALAERMVLAGCPERLCTQCDQPWKKAAEQQGARQLRTGKLTPTCACEASWRPGVVLDPFIGSGTTAIAAIRQRRDWLGIELNPTYAQLAKDRIGQETAASRLTRPTEGRTL